MCHTHLRARISDRAFLCELYIDFCAVVVDRTHAHFSAAFVRVCVATRTGVVYECTCASDLGSISLLCERVASHINGAHVMAFGHLILMHEGEILRKFCQHHLVYSSGWVHSPRIETVVLGP